MRSELNGNLSYLVLRRLVEKAWDKGDTQRLTHLSAAMDRYMLERIRQENVSAQSMQM